MQARSLFENYSTCELCGRALPTNHKKVLCQSCLDAQLFMDVKEYIRANDVNEYDVAQEFDIPLSRVKQWIREGRIEYKDKRLNSIKMHCLSCGAPITFGSLCSKCLRQQNTKGHSKIQEADPSRMRFLEEAQKKL